jgi:hypothetical protein
MKQQQKAVRWKKVSIAIVAGVFLSLAASTIYAKSRMKDDLWCVQVFPDGSEKTFYGAECYPPTPTPK